LYLLPKIQKVSWTYLRFGCLVIAILFAIAGLAITDPQYPAKRIHVPEYMIVSYLIRAGLAQHIKGWSLTLGAILAASLFGIQDELIQGIHSERTYGLPDMLVNTCGAIAGAFLSQSLNSSDITVNLKWRITNSLLLKSFSAALMLGGLVWGVIQLADYREVWIPFSLFYLCLIGLVFWLVMIVVDTSSSGFSHFAKLIAILVGTSFFFPFLVNFMGLTFR
jgi:hypothetical protein